MNLKSRKNASVNKVSSPLDTFGSAVLQVIAQDLVWGDVSSQSGSQGPGQQMQDNYDNHLPSQANGTK